MRREHTELDSPSSPSSLPSHLGNKRLTKLGLPVSDKRFITIKSVYDPTLTCIEEIREQFFADLDTDLRDTPASDKACNTRRLQRHSWQGREAMEMCDREAWSWEGEQQWPSISEQMLRAQPADYQHQHPAG